MSCRIISMWTAAKMALDRLKSPDKCLSLTIDQLNVNLTHSCEPGSGATGFQHPSEILFTAQWHGALQYMGVAPWVEAFAQ